MIMYHKDSKESANVHPSQIETMKNRGWSEKKPTSKSKKQSDEVKSDD